MLAITFRWFYTTYTQQHYVPCDFMITKLWFTTMCCTWSNMDPLNWNLRCYFFTLSCLKDKIFCFVLLYFKSNWKLKNYLKVVQYIPSYVMCYEFLTWRGLRSTWAKWKWNLNIMNRPCIKKINDTGASWYTVYYLWVY